MIFIVNNSAFMKVYLKENQFKNLVEARMDGFRVDYLANCGSFKKRLEYCKQMLGFPIGNGSSRIIFQLDDETCLKLAKNKKGIVQNIEEISICRDNIISYVPKVYNGTDEKNGLWIITQYVLPAKIEDFKEVLDVDFKDISKFASSLDTSFSRKSDNSVKMADNMIHHIYEKYENNDDAIELLNDIHELKADYDQIVVDLSRIENWGMARENGQTFLVMLDTGLSEEIFNQFYRRR